MFGFSKDRALKRAMDKVTNKHAQSVDRFAAKHVRAPWLMRPVHRVVTVCGGRLDRLANRNFLHRYAPGDQPLLRALKQPRDVVPEIARLFDERREDHRFRQLVDQHCGVCHTRPTLVSSTSMPATYRTYAATAAVPVVATAVVQDVDAGARVHQEVVVRDVPGVGARQGERHPVTGPEPPD